LKITNVREQLQSAIRTAKNKNCYSSCVRELMRRHPRFFFFSTLAGIALRLLFLFRFPAITADSFVYGDIAKNWLQHGIFGLSGTGGITPTCIRLPGYPAFLALVFAIFGMEHYRAGLVLQVLVDLGTCFLIANIARRCLSERAAKAAFLLAALCPFLANYSAAALTETWEIFFAVLALDLALTGLENWKTRTWLGCGLAIGAAILLRPDGGLLLVAVELFLIATIVRGFRLRVKQNALPLPSHTSIARACLVILIAALAPLVPWTLRNLHNLHIFQPLAPRYANEEHAFVPMGFNRWVKTWMADYASVEEIFWAVPGGPIEVDQLPSRAFDSEKQRDETEQLFDDYSRTLHITPDLDARFATLAAERIHHSPLRYYVWLPLVRIADMWLRPRTELLPCNSRWWEFDEDRPWLVLNIVIGAANLLYIASALAGFGRGGFTPQYGLLLTFVVLRSLFLGTLENPEPRYTLECYPVIVILAGALCSRSPERTSR
jgi:4-amino-4-deoxy-L-arabinose transferase-like glycosyltransferase